MTEITLSDADASMLKDALLGDAVERCAILYAAQTRRADGLVRLLVREVEIAAEADYAAQGECEAVLQPECVARVTKRATRAQLSLIFAHSHPGSASPRFSRADDGGEEHLARFLHRRHPANVHAALVMSRGGFRARQLGTRAEARVVSLGERRTVLFDPTETERALSPQFNRQVLAFGEAGQRTIESLRVAVVGLGGTGSIVVQQLVHLGVRDLILIDPDVIEESNLNRVVGSAAAHLKRPKVDVAAEWIHQFAPTAVVTCLRNDVIYARTARVLPEADFIFGCTDSHGSRAVLQQVAYQYLIPCIDVGSTISTSDGAVVGVFGRVQFLSIGLACLNCSGLLDSQQVRRDFMNTFERQLDPYITGERVPAPSVISINGTVSSIAVTMFMAVVTGIPSPARYLIYNALRATLRNVRATPAKNCYICSHSGALAKGDIVSLYARDD